MTVSMRAAGSKSKWWSAPGARSARRAITRSRSPVGMVGRVIPVADADQMLICETASPLVAEGVVVWWFSAIENAVSRSASVARSRIGMPAMTRSRVTGCGAASKACRVVTATCCANYAIPTGYCGASVGGAAIGHPASSTSWIGSSNRMSCRSLNASTRGGW